MLKYNYYLNKVSRVLSDQKTLTIKAKTQLNITPQALMFQIENLGR